jgi:hypothetical protein
MSRGRDDDESLGSSNRGERTVVEGGITDGGKVMGETRERTRRKS